MTQTAPKPITSLPGPFIDRVVGTAFLLMFVIAVIDLRNTGVQANLGPFMIGLAVFAIPTPAAPGRNHRDAPSRTPRSLTTEATAQR